jgi:hypothetical protein
MQEMLKSDDGGLTLPATNPEVCSQFYPPFAIKRYSFPLSHILLLASHPRVLSQINPSLIIKP